VRVQGENQRAQKVKPKETVLNVTLVILAQKILEDKLKLRVAQSSGLEGIFPLWRKKRKEKTVLLCQPAAPPRFFF